MGRLAEFANRLLAVQESVWFDLNVPLKDAVRAKVNERFSGEVADVAWEQIAPVIGPKIEAEDSNYAALWREWDALKAIVTVSRGGMVNLRAARSARDWVAVNAVLTPLVAMGLLVNFADSLGPARNTILAAGSVTAIVWGITFLILLAVHNGKVRRAFDQAQLESRLGDRTEAAIRALEGLWEDAGGGISALATSLKAEIDSASASRPVRKALAYSRVMEAESALNRAHFNLSLANRDSVRAHAVYAGAATPDAQRISRAKLNEATSDLQFRQAMVAKAEARLRLARMEYQSL